MKRILALLSTMLIFGSLALAQGSLSPSGAPAPSMISLDQIEPRTPIDSLPYTINTAGRYFLTGNLSNGTGTAITITVDNVDLSLNSFEIDISGSTTGIDAQNRSGIIIRNGSLTGSGGGTLGVDFQSATNCSIRKVRFDNFSTGLVAEDSTLISDCTFSSLNTAVGINGPLGDVNIAIRNCTFRDNAGGTGISILNATGVTVSGSVFSANDTGIELDGNSSVDVSACFFIANEDRGIMADTFTAGEAITVSNSVFRNHLKEAIRTAYPTTIEHCRFIGNNISASDGAVYAQNDLSISDSHFEDNIGMDLFSDDAGAVNPNTKVTITGCTFRNPSSVSPSVVLDYPSTVKTCTFSRASLEGNNHLTVSDSTFLSSRSSAISFPQSSGVRLLVENSSIEQSESNGISTSDDTHISNSRIIGSNGNGVSFSKSLNLSGSIITGSSLTNVYANAMGTVTCFISDTELSGSGGGYGFNGSAFTTVNAQFTDCHINNNNSGGIQYNNGSAQIKDCEISRNNSHGIEGGVATVLDCNIANNSGDGVRLTSGGNVLDNLITNNSTAGINYTGSNGLVRGNDVLGNGSGITVNGVDTFVYSNTATDYTIDPNSHESASVTSANLSTNTNPQANIDL